MKTRSSINRFFSTFKTRNNKMAGPGSDGGMVRYYCTAGNGMERFVMDEVKEKLKAENVCQLPGKVLFNCSAGMDRLSNLKAAERLFLLLKKDSPVQLSAHTNPAKAASVLHSTLLGDRTQWTRALMTWTRLQGELTDRRNTVNAPSSAVGVTVKRERGSRTEKQPQNQKCHTDSSSSSGAELEEENRRLKSVDQNEAQEKKKKGENEQKGRDDTKNKERKRRELKPGETDSEAHTLEKKRKTDVDGDKEEEERGDIFQDSSGEKFVKQEKQNVISEAVLGEDLHSLSQASAGSLTDSGSRSMKDMTEDWTMKHGEEKSLQQHEPLSALVSFRISCKCTGSLSRYFTTQEVSKLLGVGLSRLMGWKTDLKNPQLEINIHLSDDHYLLGIPLTRLPLANRSYIKTTGLRSTVAWAMASLAQIQPGFCVVDVMCGVGTILIEAAQEHKAASFLGVDKDDGQLLKAHENIKFAELGNRVHLLKASSLALPLPRASVDAVVCDLPFGRKFGTKENMAANLPLILSEMERVLRSGGSLVLLLSPQLSCLLKSLLVQKENGPMPNQEAKPVPRTQDCPSYYPSPTEQQTIRIYQGTNSPHTQKDPQSGLQRHLPPIPSSLQHQATYRVSLGVIDGLIHKYIKR